MSRGRSDSILTHKLIPYATLVVPEDESRLYRGKVGPNMEIVEIPPEIVGIGKVRNWILGHFEDNVIIMADDDIRHMRIASRKMGYNTDNPQDIHDALYSTARCALDLGVGLFGFSQTNGDVRKYHPATPFSLNSWVGGLIGVIGRELDFNQNKFKTDIDFTLRNLLKNRIVWVDTRMSFVQARFKNRGGNSKYRSKEAVSHEVARLKDQWGKHFTYKLSKGVEITGIRVKRRQT